MGELQEARNPGESWRGGEGEGRGPETSSNGNNRKTKCKGQSLEITQAAVWGMEQHHPIMDTLGDLGGRTYRQMVMIYLLLCTDQKHCSILFIN